MNGVQRTLAGLVGLTLGMFVFAWALVPLYDLFCEVTGLNGKVTEAAAEPKENAIDMNRTVRVRFVVEKGDGIAWDFEPMQEQLEMHPGEQKAVFFQVRNRSGSRLAARAIPSVVPGLSTQWLRKVECFCFKEQWLNPGEAAQLGMRFYFDTELPEQYGEIVIGYTLYGINQES